MKNIKCKLGLHDYVVVFTTSYGEIKESVGFMVPKGSDFLTAKKKVCLRCEKIVDEVEEVKKYYEKKRKKNIIENKKYNKRLLLADEIINRIENK